MPEGTKMSNFGRLIATMFIWAMVPASLAMTKDAQGAGQVFVVLVLALAAMGTSGFIWLGNAGAQHQASMETRAEKAKRSTSNRVDRLMRALDEEDLAELRDRLNGSDGEMPVPLDSLLANERTNRG
jgi:hypothetical protein